MPSSSSSDSLTSSRRRGGSPMSSEQSIVSIQDLSKVFRVGVGRARVREMLPWPLDRAAQSLFPRWWARDTFQALENVSLTVRRGSAVGIVGHNGAGKTTLLKIIASILAPTSGEVTVSGRIGALVDVLTGAHPELTGKENALLIGSIYGVGRRRMETRIDEILEFAEVTEFPETPLKRHTA